ncbi:uncharacterized protein K02A2.6-like isoform X3 [Ornithodoros turicata]|uniref:uncharacterized protein K02A2.6-like isoform X3 n=1 Tax=Ornithodoros turicata TaxID=34597 RepID=UPI003139BAB5
MCDESKKYLTLNTHKGLFEVNRLLFGIASAPGIFQRIMENVLKGLPKVCCYLDDLLITGSTPEEHLANLDAVLKRLLCNKATWLWSPECEHSFNKIKEVITTAPVLAHYSSYLPLQLAGDASPYGVQPAPPKSPLHPWSWPTAPWHRLHADFAGPFKGHMFLIVMDAHSKWPEVFIMGKTTTKHTIEKLHELFSRFGIPESFVTDNGPQFVSQEFKDFLKKMGIRHVTTTPYHTSSNGLAERFVQSLKTALRKGNPSTPLNLLLDRFLFRYRTTIHATTHETPAMLLFKRQLRTRLDLLKPSIECRVRHSQFVQSARRTSIPRLLKQGDRAMVRNFRRGKKCLPGIILCNTGPVSYRVRVSPVQGTSIVWRRHQDQLRLCASRTTTQEAKCDNDSGPWLAAPTDFEQSDIPSSSEVLPTSDRARGAVQRPGTPEPIQDSIGVPQPTAQERRYPVRDRRPPERYQAH